MTDTPIADALIARARRIRMNEQYEEQRGRVHRCHDCPRPISQHKLRCMFCQQVFLRELAEQIADQEMLDGMLAHNFKGREAEVLALMKPYLKFEPKEVSHDVLEPQE